jgi:hypothetical protein
MRRGGTSGLPVAKNCSCSSARHTHLRVQPLMPQLIGLSLSFGAICAHSAHSGPLTVIPLRASCFLPFSTAGASPSTAGAAAADAASVVSRAISCCRGLITATRVQPGAAQGTSLVSRLASRCSHSAHSARGGGRRVAKACSCAATGQVQVLVQPGRSQGRSASRRDFHLLRHGSHMPAVGSEGSTSVPPPRASALLES